MIFLTGDTHGEFSRFTMDSFSEQRELSRNDTIIILGDFGGIWNDSSSERYGLDWLSDKSFTLCFIDGNHENFEHLRQFEEVDFHGGRAHKIRDNIYHLMRGYVFEFENKKFFCMGGAQSHDIQDGIINPDDYKDNRAFRAACEKMIKKGQVRFRINHVSWWEEELPTQEEYDRGLESLSVVDNKVDYVLTHCLPQEIASFLGYTTTDKLTMYLNSLIYNGLYFDKWYCGHYHINRRVMGTFEILYDNIVRIV